MPLPDRHTLLSEAGPVTVVESFRASEKERRRAYPALAARGVLERIARDGHFGDRHDLFQLQDTLAGDVLWHGRDVQTHAVSQALLDAVEDGRLLVLPGWSWDEATDVAERPADDKRPESLLVSRIMVGRERVELDDRNYRIVAAQTWRENEDHGPYEVMNAKEATGALKRLHARANSNDEKAAIAEAMTKVTDERSLFGRGGVFVLRQRRMTFVVPEVEATAATPSQLVQRVATDDGHWIEIVVTYDDGTPYAGPIALVMPDGATETASINEQGLLRRDGIKPGLCKVDLPEVDATRMV